MDGKVRNFFPKDVTYHTYYLHLALKMSDISNHHAVRGIEIVIGYISRHIDIGTGSIRLAYKRTSAASAESDRSQKSPRNTRMTDC